MKILKPFLKAASLFLAVLPFTFLTAEVDVIEKPIQCAPMAQPQMEMSIFALINQVRASYNLPPLTWSPVVAYLARNHSLNMANGIVSFGHQGASQRFDIIKYFIPSSTRFGENVAYNRGLPNPAYTAFIGWLNSPSHLANIIGDYNMTGVGVVRNDFGAYYFTQIFLKAQPQMALYAPDAQTLSPLKNEGQSSEVSMDCPSEWENESLSPENSSVCP